MSAPRRPSRRLRRGRSWGPTPGAGGRLVSRPAAVRGSSPTTHLRSGPGVGRRHGAPRQRATPLVRRPPLGGAAERSGPWRDRATARISRWADSDPGHLRRGPPPADGRARLAIRSPQIAATPRKLRRDLGCTSDAGGGETVTDAPEDPNEKLSDTAVLARDPGNLDGHRGRHCPRSPLAVYPDVERTGVGAEGWVGEAVGKVASASGTCRR
jgi:hypothetical protein